MDVPDHVWDQLRLEECLDKEAQLLSRGFDLERHEVHPLFAPEKFPDADYDALLPASRDYPPGSALEQCYYEAVYPPNRPLTGKEVRRVKAEFINLANILTFHRDEHTNLRGAHCEPAQGENDVDLAGSWQDFAGWKSSVHYSELTYDNLVNAYKQTDGVNFDGGLAVDNIMFAKILCHELAHAGVFYRFGECFRGLRVDFDWETMVWGCTLTIGHQGAYLHLEEWPGIAMANAYLRRDAPLMLCGRPEKAERYWHIPPRWLLQLCSEDFWDSVVPKKGREAPYVPKLYGMRSIPNPCKCSTCLSNKEFWDFDDLEKLGRQPVPNSPSCRAGLVLEWVPNVYEKQPLECVPEGYVLLEDGKMVPQKYAKRFVEPKAMGHGWLDTRIARKTKGRIQQFYRMHLAKKAKKAEAAEAKAAETKVAESS
ncbi:hypothetical protein LTR56_005423 [Elasticomyces elasticus]|nr:hypothetical protein LTR22_015241 [Elasticomyces elasticus]KAK3651914.1 hypothetical protein LTR56_005423 [Elasticomyces elasticus]KAK4927809.1 hypothetical protein LTR49_005435 [Elasticomyces elasticus]KAK5761480.1 hypothetical protein LTS12_008443 [Elasticomyces elasticus]